MSLLGATGCQAKERQLKWQYWKTYPDFTATLWSFSDRRENINEDDVVAIYSDL